MTASAAAAAGVYDGEREREREREKERERERERREEKRGSESVLLPRRHTISTQCSLFCTRFSLSSIPRLPELAPPARGRITQPRNLTFGGPCM